MKSDFYFIHGWGFDKTFWQPVCKKIQENGFSRIAKTLDLGFFSKDLLNYDIKKINSNSIFIVHSYGLNWLLKNKIECSAIINFFGVPSFLSFQKNPHVTRKIINKMVENFKFNSTKVLNDFYKRCNVKHEIKKEVNIGNCLKSLKQLQDEDLIINFNNLRCKVFSIFSFGDNVLAINKKILYLIKNKNHYIKFFNDLEHGFPKNNPELCYQIIKNILIKLQHESI